MATIARCTSETNRVDRILMRRPAGDTHSASRITVPARRSRVRRCEMRFPYRRSNVSSLTTSRMIFPSVTLTTVCPASGFPYADSAYGSGRTSKKPLR